MSVGESVVEAGRLAALRRYEILDTQPECAFDAITSLAARLLEVPIALITLVDTDRVWFKSRYGIEEAQVARVPGLCSSAILKDGPYLVCDAAEDPRAWNNPLVAGDLGLRFYAAAPLRTPDGYNLGTLCVLDREPRKVKASYLQILESLAVLVMERLELRLSNLRAAGRNEALAGRVAELDAQHDASEDGVATVAHDLRNSLGGIMMMAKLLLEENFGKLNDSQRKMVESICGSSDKMLGVVKDGLECRARPAGAARDGITAGTAAGRGRTKA